MVPGHGAGGLREAWRWEGSLTAVLERVRSYPPGFLLRHPLRAARNLWTSAGFVELCEHVGLGVLEVQDPDDKRGNDFAVVLDASG